VPFDRRAVQRGARRELLDGLGGWQVIEPCDEPTATTMAR
jgi:hypothetical protein